MLLSFLDPVYICATVTHGSLALAQPQQRMLSLQEAWSRQSQCYCQGLARTALEQPLKCPAALCKPKGQVHAGSATGIDGGCDEEERDPSRRRSSNKHD